MSRVFKITEKQYNLALSEDTTIKADVKANNGNIQQAVEKAKAEAKKNGLDLKKTKIEIAAESKKLTLEEQVRNKFKEKSNILSIKDLLKND